MLKGIRKITGSSNSRPRQVNRLDAIRCKIIGAAKLVRAAEEKPTTISVAAFLGDAAFGTNQSKRSVEMGIRRLITAEKTANTAYFSGA